MFLALFVIYVLTCMCSVLPSVLTFIIWELEPDGYCIFEANINERKGVKKKNLIW